jgi:arylsulfatase A-like enzyme
VGHGQEMDLPGKAKPQFVYLAVIEPHVIYNPKKEFLKKYWDKPYTGPIKPVLTGIQLGKIKQGTLKVNDTDKAYLEALHNAEITQSDTAFGVFLADLKAAGLYDTSAIIVISDHGDEFWDHGDVGHAQGPHQELVHVPFMIHAPGLLPAGRVIETDVEAMDLAPTVLELAGIPVPDSMQGQSVLATALDEIAHAPSSSMTQNGTMCARDQVRALSHDPLGPGRIELYDEIEDPARAHRTGRQAPHRAPPDAQRAGPAGRLRERVEEAAVGLASQPHVEAFYGANEK